MSENVSNESIKELLEKIFDYIEAQDAEIVRGLNYHSDSLDNIYDAVNNVYSLCDRIYAIITNQILY